ncbi:MAG: hypothetical protein K6G54_01510 [Oscillospiraceae bacterium]|nr:hypothetical protein [Oscillospiraceae bacterium]
MYGRSGVDQLGIALLVAELVLSFLGGLIPLRAVGAALRLLSLVLTVLLFYRTLSRNVAKRRAENARFLQWWTPVRTGFRDVRARRADKAHKYVKCSCGTWCRVPRGVGKVELMCPRCGAKTIVKT